MNDSKRVQSFKKTMELKAKARKELQQDQRHKKQQEGMEALVLILVVAVLFGFFWLLYKFKTMRFITGGACAIACIYFAVTPDTFLLGKETSNHILVLIFGVVGGLLILLGFVGKDGDQDEEEETGEDAVMEDESTTGSGQSKIRRKRGKSKTTAIVLCVLLGLLGVHRFYTGNFWIGCLQLATLGLCGVLPLIDFILLLTGKYKDKHGNYLT